MVKITQYMRVVSDKNSPSFFGVCVLYRRDPGCCACLIPIEFERLGQNHAEAC
jgi:hypothetical protein